MRVFTDLVVTEVVPVGGGADKRVDFFNTNDLRTDSDYVDFDLLRWTFSGEACLQIALDFRVFRSDQFRYLGVRLTSVYEPDVSGLGQTSV